MRKHTFLLWAILTASFFANAQQLEIHHVNIGNGDCSIIAIKDATGNYVSKTIIDGGQSNPTAKLLPYINTVFHNTHFNLLILSHYHDDHYNGLLALKDDSIGANYIIDGGNYIVAPGAHNSSLQPPNTSAPPPAPATAWVSNISDYGNDVNHSAGRPTSLTLFPNQIKDSIILGVINGVNVTLINIAANGYNISNGGAVINNNPSNKGSQNNYSLGWLLRYGAFRYYTAGDIGGYGSNYTQTIPCPPMWGEAGNTINVTGSCTSYTDQETTLSQGLVYLLPFAYPINDTIDSYPGHVCAVKISHHGSACSNNTTWLSTLKATAYFTSAGSNNSWKLPKLNTLYNRPLALNDIHICGKIG